MQAEKHPLEILLDQAGIHRAELARRMGVTPRQVSRWNVEIPKYVSAYLELLIKFKALGGEE